MTSDEFVSVERSVVKREVLNAEEVELFKAVDHWATKECEGQGMISDGGTKRRLLVVVIVIGLCFPLTPQKDFASVVFDSGILNYEEFGNMLKYYNGFLTTPLLFLEACRIDSTQHRCCRFQTFCAPGSYWSYDGGLANCFEGGGYTVTTDIVDPIDSASLVYCAGNYASEKSITPAYYGFYVMFDRPVT